MKLFFRKYGEGKPLLILHGLFGSSDNWNSIAKKYGESFSTYIIDLRNHGQSPHDPEWNYQLMSDDIVELINSEGLEKVSIMGHSMGGKVAMFLAGKIPDKIDKLIVSDIGTKYYKPHHTEIITALKGLDLGKVHSRKDAENYMETKIDDVGVRQFLLKNLYWKDEQLAWRFNLDVISEKIEAVGEKLPDEIIYSGKTLFIKGGNSKYIVESDYTQILQQFPNAEFISIPGAGHWIHAEKPIEYFDTTMKFLK